MKEKVKHFLDRHSLKNLRSDCFWCINLRVDRLERIQKAALNFAQPVISKEVDDLKGGEIA